MRAEIAAALVVIAAAIGGVRYWETSAERLGEDAAPAATALSAAAVQRAGRPSPYSKGWGEEVRVVAGRDNQYYVTASVNNSPASFLVDTGASYVALRESDARRAGIYTAWTDYDQPVRTANGETRAALVTLREIEISGIRVSNVEAFILADDQLSVNLLVMRFLSRIESVEAKGGELVLRG